MSNNSPFSQNNTEELFRLISEHPLATLVTTQNELGLQADHIPLMLKNNNQESCILQGHIAVSNPLWKKVKNNSDVLCVFQGGNTYISPSYYPSKKKHGKVVPTWNYMVVHAKGAINFIQDNEWKLDFLKALTHQHEQSASKPWTLDDAPEEYITAQLSGFVGFEINVQSLTGKWKLSQNKQKSDKEGVIKALFDSGDANKVNIAERMQNLKD